MGHIEPILGLRAWGASLGIGSFITFEFGPPRVPEWLRPSGDYQVWIYWSAWRLETEQSVVVACEDPREIRHREISRIDTRVLTDVGISFPGLDTVFEFGPDLRLRVFPNTSCEEFGWGLRMPGGHLAVGPGSSWSYDSKRHASLRILTGGGGE